MSSDLVRWLLRVLVEPAFLQYYVLEPAAPLSLSTFKAEFFALAPDQERPAETRLEAWRRLQRWIPVESEQGVPPARWFQCILRGLRDDADLAPHLQETARFWALHELFDRASDGEPPQAATGEDRPYHELHCHFRGGVPFFVLWHGLLFDARQRASLRTKVLLDRDPQVSWAELLERVVDDTPHGAVEELDEFDEGCARTRVMERVCNLLDPERSLADLRRDVQYAAACAGLATYLRHQRTRGGLAPFAESYEQYSKVQKRAGVSDELTAGHMARKLLQRFERDGAVAVEVRPTLERTRAELQRKLRGLARGYLEYVRDSEAPVAMGLVPSLFKQELGRKKEPASPEFWQRQQDTWVCQVESLLEVLREDPVLRWLVVGLDAAGQERGCPPGALAPAFALVREYNQGNQYARPGRAMNPATVQHLLRARPNTDPLQVIAGQRHWMEQRIRLGITVHAGEDFEDPLTGLRHIWESVELLGLRDGDRVGHALAAGLERDLLEEMLARRHGSPPGARCDSYRLAKPRGTHLLDLAWLAQWAPEPHRRAARMHLGEVATRALGAPVNVEWILQELRACGSIPTFGIPGARFLAGDGLRAGDLEHVVLDDTWRGCFEAMRQQVLRLLVRKRVVVESCPTSNLVVANLRTPPIKYLLHHSELRVVVATDDPGLLESYPRRECSLMQPEHLPRLLQQAQDASFVWQPPQRAP